VEAIELPDREMSISMGRSRYGHAEWVRFDTVNGRFHEAWGVFGVVVRNIPPQYWDSGVYKFTFSACHDPLERDYPHSEVRVFKNSMRVLLQSELPEDIELKWRYALLDVMETIIKPKHLVEVREKEPVSFKLEPHRVIEVLD
jgi:hypothetical protein